MLRIFLINVSTLLSLVVALPGSAHAGWRIPTGITLISVGGVLIVGGLAEAGTYSSDECESEYQGETDRAEKERACKTRVRKNETRAFSTAVVGGSLIATGIVIMRTGAQQGKLNSDGESVEQAESVFGLGLNRAREPMLSYVARF